MLRTHSQLATAMIALALSFAAAASANAQAPNQAIDLKSPELIKLAITPAAEPVPSLKYQLLPPFSERRPGNAAPLYAQAALSYAPTAEAATEIDKLLKAPATEFGGLVQAGKTDALLRTEVLSLLRIAARRERCDWELPIREQMVFNILLPEQQKLRELARLVALQARVHGAKKEYPQAIEALQTGYAMARHNSAAPVLINGLVSIAIARMMDDVVLDLAQRSGAPNLYWALTFRPSPLIELGPALEGEMYALELSIPGFRDAATKEPAAANWDAIVEEMMKMLDLAQVVGADGKPTAGSDLTGFLMRRVSVVTAKTMLNRTRIIDYLVACGLRRYQVERMGNAQLFVVHSKMTYDELRDQLFRWTTLPYPQARAGMNGAEAKLRPQAENRDELFPWGQALLPAVSQVCATHARAQRSGDALRVVEALRLYAASHAGRLPKSLEELSAATPIGADCVTGEPFDYQLTGDTAKLTLREEKRGAKTTVVYEITVAK